MNSSAAESSEATESKLPSLRRSARRLPQMRASRNMKMENMAGDKAKEVHEKARSDQGSGRLIEVAFWFVVWYLSSVMCTNFSKELVKILGSGKVLTLLQLIGSTILGRVVLSIGPGVKSCPGIEKQMWILGAVFSGGFLSLNVGMQYMHVSMAMVLRSTEPLFAVGLIVFSGGKVSLSIAATLVIIVTGAALSAFDEPNFSITGLFFLVGANFCFCFRSIVAKAIKDCKDIDNVSLFFHCCWRGALIQMVVVGVFEFRRIMEYPVTIPEQISLDAFAIKLALNVMAYFAYLQASFIVLSMVGVVSHTVGNSLRRPVCIACAVVYFGNPISSLAFFGICLACVGAGLYSILKATGRSPRNKTA